MARTHARIVTAIWNDPDFLALHSSAQRMFMALLTQAKITMIGSLDYTPKRWANHAPDLTTADIEQSIVELEHARFVLVDRDAEEMIVRTFVKGDGSAGNSRQRAAMWSAWEALASPTLQLLVLDHLPDEAWSGPDDRGIGGAPDAAIALRAAPSPAPSDSPSDSPSEGASDTHRYAFDLLLEPEPVPENPPSSADADGEPDPFDEFWAACPRKVGKTDARRKFDRATRNADPQALIDAMRAHADRWAADGTDRRFIPHPATWLHQGRWADELIPSDTGPPEFRPNPILERNARRAAGQACPDCADTGWLDDTDPVRPCPCQSTEAYA